MKATASSSALPGPQAQGHSLPLGPARPGLNLLLSTCALCASFPVPGYACPSPSPRVCPSCANEPLLPKAGC